MNAKRGPARRVGDVVGIPLGDGRFAFAWVLDDPLFAVFDLVLDTQDVAAAEVVTRPPLFHLWVMKYAITKRIWPVLGHVEPKAADRVKAWFYKQDRISGKVSLTLDGSQQVPCDKEAAARHESATVWDPGHVAERIRDHYAGVPNKWLATMAIR